jgi:hypothetical protein
LVQYGFCEQKFEQTHVTGHMYTVDWDNHPLIQVPKTTSDTLLALEQDIPPTLARPCPCIVDDTSEVDKQ